VNGSLNYSSDALIPTIKLGLHLNIPLQVKHFASSPDVIVPEAGDSGVPVCLSMFAATRCASSFISSGVILGFSTMGLQRLTNADWC
jgi:hypothetical protein